MSDKQNLIEIINLCWDSTDGSKVGPIFQSKNDEIKLNQVGLQTFYTILSNVLPKNIASQNVEPQDPWKTQ